MHGKETTTVKRIVARGGLAAAALAAAAMPALAQDAPTVNTGDAAWMLTSTALVLMMTVPGVALFYAGMVRKKNVLATMMQSFFICGLVSVLWVVVGYSLAFGDGNAYVGDFSKVLLSGIAANWDKPFTVGSADPAGTVPESIFVTFQMTFAVITAALITGSIADRMKFSALVVFISGRHDRFTDTPLHRQVPQDPDTRDPSQTAQAIEVRDACKDAVYAPFPELEKLTR